MIVQGGLNRDLKLLGVGQAALGGFLDIVYRCFDLADCYGHCLILGVGHARRFPVPGLTIQPPMIPPMNPTRTVIPLATSGGMSTPRMESTHTMSRVMAPATPPLPALVVVTGPMVRLVSED